ncbi:MAG: M23 family metallopeptidase [Clostridia bacterium]|nr:M23 family metallopeptidase [Clostridia bacterium]MEE0866171.1 M23 family metallopeptidase [Clostridia bacterium]
MADNKNQVAEMGKLGFSLLSFKTKMIIIGVVIGIFLIIIVPVVAIMSIFTPAPKNSSQKKGGDKGSNSSSGTSVTISVNEVFDEGSLVKYENATFPMPFETWDKSKDVVTSRFSRSRTITVNGRTQTGAHTGMDIVCISKASPKICAVASGTVVVAKAGSTGYGNYVVIQHISDEGKRFYTLYGHMVDGSIAVAEGSEVKVGQVLGIMGSTGNSTGPHLHFEVRLNDNTSSSAVNPYPYLFGEEES